MKIGQSNQPKYTRGPYFYRLGRDGVDDVWFIAAVSAPHGEIASLRFWDDGDGLKAAKHEPNVRLLAAAPELFEALDRLVTIANDPELDIADYDVIGALSAASTVLAKVRG